jgi:16S rRNA (adenine1518-N6/adenine1519-N6)-dimethyltransferase
MKQRKKKTHPIRAKKSLGQNFLKNYGIVRKIVETAKIQKGETVLEIGPGRGVLTQALLEAGARVIAVEKDRELIPILEETFHEQIKLGLLTVCHEDILTFDLARCEKTYKVVANIPYYITGQIIRMLLSASNQPKTLIMMAQDQEVGHVILSYAAIMQTNSEW